MSRILDLMNRWKNKESKRMVPGVTVVLTSCGRADLLAETLNSFFEFNDHPVELFLVVEDSRDPAVPDMISEQFGSHIELFVNERRYGQIKSIDDAYSKVTTPYIFHCEDDWRFFRSGFMRESIDILESDPEIFQVQLRDQWDNNGHPPERKRFVTAAGTVFRRMRTGFRGRNGAIYHGFSFNPGLRRLSDYNLVGPYESIGHEVEIGEAYFRIGLYSAILEEAAVEHIGDGRHVRDVHELGRNSLLERLDSVAARWLPPVLHDSLLSLKKRRQR